VTGKKKNKKKKKKKRKRKGRQQTNRRPAVDQNPDRSDRPAKTVWYGREAKRKQKGKTAIDSLKPTTTDGQQKSDET
jgi:hypothetical protein